MWFKATNNNTQEVQLVASKGGLSEAEWTFEPILEEPAPYETVDTKTKKLKDHRVDRQDPQKEILRQLIREVLAEENIV